jgi:hypothetical protein
MTAKLWILVFWFARGELSEASGTTKEITKIIAVYFKEQQRSAWCATSLHNLTVPLLSIKISAVCGI